MPIVLTAAGAISKQFQKAASHMHCKNWTCYLTPNFYLYIFCSTRYRHYTNKSKLVCTVSYMHCRETYKECLVPQEFKSPIIVTVLPRDLSIISNGNVKRLIKNVYFPRSTNLQKYVTVLPRDLSVIGAGDGGGGVSADPADFLSHTHWPHSPHIPEHMQL
jgi:hypothetical protein